MLSQKLAGLHLVIKILQEKYWKLSKVKPSACEVLHENLFEDIISIYSANSPVFGIERVMYSLNTYATCLSPIVANDYITDLPDLLLCLDKNASESPEKFNLDRHLIAFIAAKLNITNDVEVKVLANFPKFSDHPLMYGLSLLNLAQKAAPEIKIQNLCNIIVTKVIELFEEYLHNITFKKQIIYSTSFIYINDYVYFEYRENHTNHCKRIKHLRK